jgi:hypothetical protein
VTAILVHSGNVLRLVCFFLPVCVYSHQVHKAFTAVLGHVLTCGIFWTSLLMFWPADLHRFVLRFDLHSAIAGDTSITQCYKHIDV